MPRHLRVWIGLVAFALLIAGDVRAQDFKFLEVKVVDSDGKPMAEVPVDIRIDSMEFPMPTDAKGIVSINVPAGDSTELKLAVNHEGYAGVQARWGKGGKIPAQFTIPLKRGTTIGGMVHNEAGEPVEGAKVEATITAFNDYDMSWGKGELRPSIPSELGVTDKDGRWEFNAAPDEDAAIQMRFIHPDYVSDSGFSFRGGNWEELQAKSKIVVMQKGITLAGRILDPQGKPLPGARLMIGDRFMSNRVVATADVEGRYSIPNQQSGSIPLTVMAAGFAPELKNVAATIGMSNVDIPMQPGNSVRIKIVDKAGLPIAGVRVTPDEWRGNRSIEEPAKRETDAQGIWEWTEAPADEVLYSIYKDGNMGINKPLVASGEEHTITMLPAVVVNGTVVDKETKRPIESFKYVEGVWWDPEDTRYVLQSMNVESGKNGKFRFQMESACEKFCVRVEADGYRPLVSREILPDEGEIEVTFELEKGQGPQGMVLTPDGNPAESATVVLGSEEQAAQIWDGSLQDFSITKMTTGVDGKYRLPIVEGDYMLVALHETGWAELKNPDAKAAAEVKLVPWSTVKGIVWQGDKPVAQEQVIVYFDLSPGNPRPLRIWNYDAETDGEGNFEFKHVRSGEAILYRRFRYASTGNGWITALSHKQQVQLLPGEITEVKLGGKGRQVRGKLTALEKDRDQIDWNFGLVQLNPVEKADSRLNTDARYAAPIKSDGTFEIVDVAPDDYSLKVAVYAKDYRTSRRWDPIAILKQSCEVAEGDSDEAVDLGSFTVELVKSQD